MHSREEIARGQNAVLAHETIDLHPQGDEGDEINNAEAAQKDLARGLIRGAADIRAPE